MITEAQREQRRQAGRKGGQARAKQFTSDYQRRARACVRPESNRANGRKGYAATEAKHPGLAAAKLAEWRQNNPSTPESVVDTWLSEMNLTAAREVPLGGLFLDRVVGLTAIEIDGDGLHGDRAPDAEARARNDARKEALAWALGYTFIRLPEAAVRDGSARQTLETEFLQQPLKEKKS